MNPETQQRFEQEPASFYREKPLSIETQGGIHLAGNIMYPKETLPGGKVPTVVIMHGAGGEFKDDTDRTHSTYDPMKKIRHIQEMFAQNGIATIVYASRGIAGSGGKYNEQKFSDRALDAKRIIAAVKQDPSVDVQNLSLLAVSMSAHIAGEVAQDSNIKKLLLWEPAAYDQAAEKVPIGSKEFTEVLHDQTRNLLASPAFSSLRGFRQNGGDVFLAYGAQDEIVPRPVYLGYRQYVNNPTQWLELASMGHKLLDNPADKTLPVEKKRELELLYRQSVSFVKKRERTKEARRNSIPLAA